MYRTVAVPYLFQYLFSAAVLPTNGGLAEDQIDMLLPQVDGNFHYPPEDSLLETIPEACGYDLDDEDRKYIRRKVSA